MSNLYSHDDLTGRIKSPRWSLVAGKDDTPKGALEELLHVTHQKHGNGKPPGRLSEAATSVQLEILQIERLWRYLGLPV